MQIVAITGSIGCGKTTIADLLREIGYTVYDVDKWCRKLYKKIFFIKKVHELFPAAFENGELNKRKLRQIVFSQPAQLKRLEHLTHPFLKQIFLKTIHRGCRRPVTIFVDVAILYEMGWDKYCTSVIVADAPYEVQKKRVMTRDKISESEFKEIIQVQLDNNKKMKMADFVINTDKPLGRLKAELSVLVNGLDGC